MSTGTLVKIPPVGEVIRTRIERKTGPTMEEIRDQVGGYYEQIGVIFGGEKRTAYIDEDARIKRQPPPVNEIATRMVQAFYADRGRTVDILGNIVIWVPNEKPKTQGDSNVPGK